MRGNKALRLREPASARIIFCVTPKHERMLAAMCGSENRTVADMMRILIEEGAKARKITVQEGESI